MLGNIKKDGGFTFIELVVVILILGIIAAFAYPKMVSIVEDARINSTKDEMMKLKIAIVGDASLVTGGVSTFRGYRGDVGSNPAQLQDLVVKPDTVEAWDRTANNGLGAGWNGPYINDDGSGNYLYDAWGNPYVLTPNAIISSGPNGVYEGGGGDDIVLYY